VTVKELIDELQEWPGEDDIEWAVYPPGGIGVVETTPIRSVSGFGGAHISGRGGVVVLSAEEPGPKMCLKPVKGYRCTLDVDHEGPCDEGGNGEATRNDSRRARQFKR
jgi:hypothetical protein